MNNKKRIALLTIFVLLIIIVFLSGGFIALDWSRFMQGASEMRYTEYPLSRAMKLCVSFVCAVLAWTVGNDCFNSKDSLKIKVIFSTVFLADTLIYFNQTELGIGVFGICQILLIYRNGTGVKKFISSGGLAKHKLSLISSGLGIFAVSILSIIFVFHPILKGSIIFYAIVVYMTLLSSSVWVGWSSTKIGFFPSRNASFIAIGMTAFFLCDFTVGLDISLKPGIYWLISTSLTWIFYTPALVLIALSGFDFNLFTLFKFTKKSAVDA